MMNQYLTFLRRSVGLTTLAAMLSWALLVDALGYNLLGGKPPHHSKVSFNRGGSGCVFESRCSPLNFRYCACFMQGVSWHLGNYRLCGFFVKRIRDTMRRYSQTYCSNSFHIVTWNILSWQLNHFSNQIGGKNNHFN